MQFIPFAFLISFIFCCTLNLLRADISLTFEDQGYQYVEQADGTLHIIGVTPADLPIGRIEIPSMLPTDSGLKPVVRIEDDAMQGLPEVLEIVIPDSVISIGSNFLRGFSALRRLELGKGVSEISVDAFPYLPSLLWIDVAEDNAHFSTVTGVLFNKDQTVIRRFPQARSGDYVIPDSVTDVGAFAFALSSGLMSITIPNSVTEIGPLAFSGCSSIRHIKLPDSLEKMGSAAFANCRALSQVDLGSGLVHISENAFTLTGIEHLVIPDQVVSIDRNAFALNRQLKSVHLGSSVEDLHRDAFDLQVWNFLTIASDNPNWVEIDGLYYNSDQTILRRVPIIKEGSFTIPETIIYIDDSAFLGCRQLTEVVVSEAVTTIGDSAFSNCSELESVHLPDQLQAIGKSAFIHCKALKIISIPDSVETLGSYAFQGCESLEMVDMGEGISEIPPFCFDGCAALHDIALPSGLRKINRYAFSQTDLLQELTLPPTIEIIAEGAFWRSGLTEFSLPDSVHTIESKAFAFCSQLAAFDFGNSLTTIGARAFEHANQLTEIRIPDSVTTLGERAFWGCDEIAVVTMGTGITHIADEVFAYCEKLRVIQLPEFLVSIGNRAFLVCDLMKARIPPRVESMAGDAFDYNNDLHLYFSGDAPVIEGPLQFRSRPKLTFLDTASGFETDPWTAFTSFKKTWKSLVPSDWIMMAVGDPSLTMNDTINGVPLILRYALNSDPESSLQHPQYSFASRNPLAMEFFSGRENVEVLVEVSVDLKNWSSEAILLSEGSKPDHTRATAPESDQPQFMRIRVIGPNSI